MYVVIWFHTLRIKLRIWQHKQILTQGRTPCCTCPIPSVLAGVILARLAASGAYHFQGRVSCQGGPAVREAFSGNSDGVLPNLKFTYKLFGSWDGFKNISLFSEISKWNLRLVAVRFALDSTIVSFFWVSRKTTNPGFN